MNEEQVFPKSAPYTSANDWLNKFLPVQAAYPFLLHGGDILPVLAKDLVVVRGDFCSSCWGDYR